VRYSLCRLNAGSGGEDFDEPPDCLYGLQVRGPPISLGGSLFWVVGGFGVGGRPCCSSVSLCWWVYCSAHWIWAERPSAPGSWGRYVSGDTVYDLASARGHEWLATCVPVQDVSSQGIL